ncbi:MAG: protein translocase subunit SecD [Sphingopyxis sp.]|nr:protein translocase subunit SecD [Sphingopyxis sp.]
MLDFPRWKIVGVWLVLLTGLVLAVPSFVPPQWLSAIPEEMRPRVNLGLDLAGGSHLLLEADINDVRIQRIAAEERAVRDAMRGEPGSADDIAIGDLTRGANSISFLVRDAAQLDEARERLNSLTTGVGVTGQRTWTIEVRDSTRIVMTQTEAGLQEFVSQAMLGARDIVERRVNALGTREPTIILQGSDRIVVQVPGLQDPQALKNLLGQTARLEFREVLEDGQFDPVEAAAGRAPVGAEVVTYLNPEPGGRAFEVVSRQVMITGDQLVDAQQSFDQNNQAVVSIAFNSQGATTFARITREQVNQRFAMLVDGKVLSAPSIDEPILGGQAQIRGGFTVESASAMAIALKSGALPVKLAIVEERTVGPDLGQESIERGAIAGIAATLLTLAFMLVVYGRFGVYANIGLIFNIILIVGVMAVAGATLTLPGIAGFVLTIGAAVDANVLINERIREEMRRGRRVIAAVETGYKEASRAIFDANITNVIAAALMFVFGSGPIKGFAVVLTIGIVTSVFTAVTVSRMFVSQYLRRARPQTINI